MLLFNFTDTTGIYDVLAVVAFGGGLIVAGITYLYFFKHTDKRSHKITSNALFTFLRFVLLLAVPFQGGITEELFIIPQEIVLPLLIAFAVIATSLDTWQLVKWSPDIDEYNKSLAKPPSSPKEERLHKQTWWWVAATVISFPSDAADAHFGAAILFAAVSAFMISKLENKILRIFCSAGVIAAVLFAVVNYFLLLPNFAPRIARLVYVGYAFVQWYVCLQPQKYCDSDEQNDQNIN